MQGQIIRRTIVSFMFFIVVISKYVHEQVPALDLPDKLRSKRFLSFRILAKFLRLNKNDIPQPYLATEYYQSLWNSVPRHQDSTPLHDLVTHPTVLIYFTSSQYVLKKLNAHRLRYTDLEHFRQIEKVEQQKALSKLQEKSTHNHETALRRLQDKFQLYQATIDQQHEMNQLYVHFHCYPSESKTSRTSNAWPRPSKGGPGTSSSIRSESGM